MPRYECFATFIHRATSEFIPSNKFVVHESIDAESVREAVRRLGDILADRLAREVKFLSSFDGGLETFRVSGFDAGQRADFVDELQRRVRTQAPGFSATHAKLGDSGFVVHVFSPDVQRDETLRRPRNG